MMRTASMIWSAGETGCAANEPLGAGGGRGAGGRTEGARDDGRMMRRPATYFASLGAGAFLMNALFGMLTLVATAFAAHAQERVVFVAKIPPIRSWCGDRAVIFDGRRGLTWLDVFDKRRINLKVTKSDVWLLACSPN